MRLKTTDLMAFAYCPFMYQNGGTGKLVSPLSLQERLIRESILGAEQRALDQNSYITPRKIGNIWEKLWWPIALKLGLTPTETEEKSVQVARKFVDYCRYDISNASHQTVGLDIKSEIQLGGCIVSTEIDLVKMPLFENRNTLVLIDFKRKDMKSSRVANDIEILTNMYAFRELNRAITYITVDLSENLKKTKMVFTYYEPKDLDKVGKTLNYLAEGIRKGIDYQYSWMCDRCNKCGRK
jgi:hypothetical protein